MDNHKLFNTFLRDGESFTSELGIILLKLETHPEDKDLLNHAFRNAHSLKSEASFLKQKDIIEITHNMESVFDRFRNSNNLIDSTIIDGLLLSLDHFFPTPKTSIIQISSVSAMASVSEPSPDDERKPYLVTNSPMSFTASFAFLHL